MRDVHSSSPCPSEGAPGGGGVGCHGRRLLARFVSVDVCVDGPVRFLVPVVGLDSMLQEDVCVLHNICGLCQQFFRSYMAGGGQWSCCLTGGHVALLLAQMPAATPCCRATME